MNRLFGPTGTRLLAAAFLAVALMAAAATVWADGVVYAPSGTAIHGYDPVAYFTGGKPVEGTSEITHQWMGATWRFASAGHREAFAREPAKYAPQYGGYCSWAASQGYTASTDPEAWSIVGGKLYLNYSKGIQNRWKKNAAENIAAGDRNWPAIKAKLAN